MATSEARAAQLPHVIVSTSGRIHNLILLNKIKCESVRLFCLWQAERLFQIGSLKDVRPIFWSLPANVQTLMFMGKTPEPAVLDRV